MPDNKVLVSLCLLLCLPCEAQETAQTDASATQPSMQLLEFLAEFGAIDNQTYELIEYHALQDEKASVQELSDDH